MDTMRWRYGDTNPVCAPVRGNTVIELGELVWLDRYYAEPLPKIISPRELVSGKYVARFLGVAMQRSGDREVNHLRTATSGVFEFRCDPGKVFALGTMLGPLGGDHVDVVDEPAMAIGRVCLHKLYGLERVYVAITSQIMGGGLFGHAPREACP